ncbi:MAG: DUF5916 domain-containing protein [Bacteroidota bacterium]
MKIIKLLTAVIIFNVNIFSQNSIETKIECVAKAIKAEQSPQLDGDILNDKAYFGISPMKNFIQNSPNENYAASESTEVFVLYTKDTLYIGAFCFDSSPDKIIMSDGKRDGSLTESDCFQIMLDTYGDNQNGFLFATTPTGIEYDAQISNNGEVNQSSRMMGISGGVNVNWDASWKIKTKISENGWGAEFAIPFRTLRYLTGDLQRWGINFQRNISRKQEKTFWAFVPRQFEITRVSLAGQLQELKISNQQNLKATPFFLSKNLKSKSSNSKIENNFGFDSKYAITPSVTLDLTYNTDFAQVEADEQQVNLDRFDLFFPEKRPFFLENAGIFDIGSPGEVEMFFSRRIGIGSNGEVIPIIGGARLSGKINSTKFGFLNMQTSGVENISTENNFSVARVSQELENRSSVGAMIVGKNINSNTNFNQLFAGDFKIGYGENGLISGFYSKTNSPTNNFNNHSFKLGATYNTPMVQYDASYTEVGENFNPEVGFLRRKSFRKGDMLIFSRLRPENNFNIQELRPHISYRGFWNFTNIHESGFLHIDNHTEFKNGMEIHTGINLIHETVLNSFNPYNNISIQAGTFNHYEGQFIFMTKQSSELSFYSMMNIGGYYGGERLSISPSLKWKMDQHLTLNLSLSRNQVSIPSGDFTTNLTRLRASYYFTPDVLLETLIQHNDKTKIFSMNLRFGWLRSSNTGLFFVYNQTSDILNDALGIKQQSVVLKYSHIFDLL